MTSSTPTNLVEHVALRMRDVGAMSMYPRVEDLIDAQVRAAIRATLEWLRDNPDELAIYAMRDAYRSSRRGGAGGMTVENQFKMEYGPELAAYRAMISAALEEIES